MPLHRKFYSELLYHLINNYKNQSQLVLKATNIDRLIHLDGGVDLVVEVQAGEEANST